MPRFQERGGSNEGDSGILMEARLGQTSDSGVATRDVERNRGIILELLVFIDNLYSTVIC